VRTGGLLKHWWQQRGLWAIGDALMVAIGVAIVVWALIRAAG
jgi:hypothetical protein